MLYIICNNSEFKWHVDEDCPDYFNLSEVIEVQADNEELRFIKDNYKDLPSSHGLSQRWFGDHAKFIVGNIDYINKCHR